MDVDNIPRILLSIEISNLLIVRFHINILILLYHRTDNQPVNEL